MEERKIISYDPMTGEPIYEGEVTDSPGKITGYDPMTGEPIYEGEVTDSPGKITGYNPMTGEPIYEGAVTDLSGKITGYDPMTGEPIYGQMDESIEDMAVRYNPMTGKRVYKNEIAVKQWKEERKTVFLILAGIAVTIALLVSLVKSGFFLSEPYKVLYAIQNTVKDDNYFLRAVEPVSMLWTDYCTVSGEMREDDREFELQMAMGKNSKVISGEFRLPEIAKIDIKAQLTEEALYMQIPLLGEDIYRYNYHYDSGILETLINDGTVVGKINRFLSDLAENNLQWKEISEELQKAAAEEISGWEFEKLPKKTFTVNGRNHRCRGYQVELTRDRRRDLLEAIEDVLEDNFYGVARLWMSASFNEAYAEAEKAPDAELAFYIYKGKLAGIAWTENGTTQEMQFQGGKFRWQNIKFIEDGEEVAELKGSTNGRIEELELYADGTLRGKVFYDAKSGDFSLTGTEGDQITGSLETGKDEVAFSWNKSGNSSGAGQAWSVRIRKGMEMKGFSSDRDSAVDINPDNLSQYKAIFDEIVSFFLVDGSYDDFDM